MTYRTPGINKIEELKNFIAKYNISMIEFHSACYSRYSPDSYEMFLHKLHFYEIWTKPMELGFKLLEEVVLG